MRVMGRSIPDENLSLIHPFLYLSFVAAGFAASMAIITALCIRKKTPPPTLSDDLEVTIELNESSPPSTMETKAASPEHPQTSEAETQNNDMLLTKDLPLPPAMQQPRDSNMPKNFKKSASERKLSFSLSLKVPRSLSMAKRGDPKYDYNVQKKGKLKADESLWMKTIILGEKCVPDDEEDPVIYERKGKKISTYHPKNCVSMSLSRQCSFSDPDAFPCPQNTEENINKT